MGQVAQVQWLPPLEEKQSVEGSSFSQGIWWGISAACGRRDEMEDTFVAVSDLGRPVDFRAQPRADWSQTSVFGVFDGHGGDATAKFCEENMARAIASFPSHNISSALLNAFVHVDEMARGSNHKGSGSTAIVCCVRPDSLVVANAGDCRAVMCRAGQAVDMSVDHKPCLDSERERIENAGGWVEQESGEDADSRVNGEMAISRAIGDFHFKKDTKRGVAEQLIIPTPDVKTFQRSRKDEFMIIASDGVWDVLSSQAAIDWVRCRLGRRSDMEERLQDGSLTPASIAEGLIDHCLAPRPGLLYGVGEDNMTVVLVVFVKKSLD